MTSTAVDLGMPSEYKLRGTIVKLCVPDMVGVNV